MSIKANKPVILILSIALLFFLGALSNYFVVQSGYDLPGCLRGYDFTSHDIEILPRVHPTSQVQILCDALFDEVRSGKLKDPNAADIKVIGEAAHKRLTSTQPAFWVSLHNEETDAPRWATMKYGLYYERYVTEHAKQILLTGVQDGDSRGRGIFVDVGMNIGWFSLWARALGAKVYGFEPNPVNRLRLCESMKLNGFSENDIHVHGVAVGDVAQTLKMIHPKDNPGQATFINFSNAADAWGMDAIVYDDIEVLLLDDIAEREGWLKDDTPPIALLKVDVEGADPEVFFGAEKLIKSGRVLNIFMEYSCNLNTEDKMIKVAKQLIGANFSIEIVGRWDGNDKPGAKEAIVGKDGSLEKEFLAERLLYYCKDRRDEQLNLWWKLDDGMPRFKRNRDISFS